MRDEIRTIKACDVHLKSGASVAGVDYAVMCTGWGDHFAMFDDAHKERIGLPAYTGRDLYSFPIVSSSPDFSSSVSSSSLQQEHAKKGLVDWAAYDEAADKLVDKKLPFLAKTPVLKQSPDLLDARRQKKWRLYRRAIPVEMAARGDRSLAVLGQSTYLSISSSAASGILCPFVFYLARVCGANSEQKALWRSI